jgi:hypothetical protein
MPKGILAKQTTVKGCDATLGVRGPAERDFDFLECAASGPDIRPEAGIACVPVAWTRANRCGACARAGAARWFQRIVEVQRQRSDSSPYAQQPHEFLNLLRPEKRRTDLVLSNLQTDLIAHVTERRPLG